MEFYWETTEGFLSKYVRDQMFCYEPADVESFGAQAVNMVQIERQRIRIGDSDTKRLDGLVPVTRPIKEGSDYEQASHRPRVPANTGEWEGANSDSEEEEAGQVGREGGGPRSAAGSTHGKDLRVPPPPPPPHLPRGHQGGGSWTGTTRLIPGATTEQ